MACVDVALGEVASADLVVTDAGTTETALGTVPSTDDIRKADTTDAALGGIGTTVDVQVAETAGDCLTTMPPLDCTTATWASCYQLDATSLAALQTCAAGTDADDSTEDEWDGTFLESGLGCYDIGGGWYSQYWYGAQPFAIGGKAVNTCELFYFSDGVTAWFEVNIMLEGGSYPILVDNLKTIGVDPTGLYEDGGQVCTPLEVTVEECPA